MNFSIGTAPCSFGVWYADGTPTKIPYEKFLDYTMEAGYKCFELGPMGYLPTDVGVLKDMLESRELSVCAGTGCFEFLKLSDFKDIRQQIDDLCRHITNLDAKYLVSMDGSDIGDWYLERKSEPSIEVWNAFLKIQQEMQHYTKEEYGIMTVFHPHIRTMVENEKEIISLLEYTDINLCFDTGHHAFCNGNRIKGEKSAIDFLRKYAKRIPYLHFKNVDEKIANKVFEEKIDSDTAFEMGVMCYLEDGIIDFRELMRALYDIGFSGIGIIEQDTTDSDYEKAYMSAIRNINYMEEIRNKYK